MLDKMNLNFAYRITYSNGKGYDTRNKDRVLVIELTRSEYVEIAKYTAAGGDLNASVLNSILEGVVRRMKERVMELDGYYSMEGRLLSKPLKKSREIKDIEVWVDDYDLERFKRMRDIDKVFARPEQSIILSRYDGSTVKVTVKDGIADIWDLRKPGQYRRMEEEWLANIISGQ